MTRSRLARTSPGAVRQQRYHGDENASALKVRQVFEWRVRDKWRRLVRRRSLLADNMDSYQVLTQVGEGAYGRVFKGRRKHVGQVRSVEEGDNKHLCAAVNTTLRVYVQILLKPTIVGLIELNFLWETTLVDIW